MNKILLIEDNPEKIKLIAKVVESKRAKWSLSLAANVLDAKAALKATLYDIVLLDIHLPRKASALPSADGGLEILRWLRTRGMSYRPKYIVGLTAFSESLKLAKSEFDNLIWRVLESSLTETAWTKSLSNALDDISDQSGPPYPNDGSTHQIDLLVVTALPEPELEAVINLPGTCFSRCDVRYDASAYYRGTFSKGGASLSVVAVAASDKGLAGTAIAATKGICAFWPKFIYMAGITAGVKGRTRIGDVIFADLTWDWGSGKLKTVKGQQVFHPAPYQRRLDETLASAAKNLKKETALLENWREEYPGDKPDYTPRVLVGAMASGASVLQSSQAVKKVIDQHKDLLAIEMEAFSLMFAAQTSPNPRPLPIVGKSVCDNGDGKKNDKYQRYAAYMSAKVLEEFALRYLTIGDAD